MIWAIGSIGRKAPITLNQIYHMKNKVFITASAVMLLSVPMANCSTTDAEEPAPIPDVPEGQAPDRNDFALTASMKGAADLVGQDYNAIHKYMRSLGWDYSEHPNSSEKDHHDGIHCAVVYDEAIGQYVFRFFNHANADVLDGDRGSIVDRQRNEMKTQTSDKWCALNGNWDERQRLQWKFRLPKGFRPSSSFCHIHQLKAQEGNNGAPLITITPRSNPDGSNKRVQVIHTGDVSSTTKGVIIDNLPFSDFEDEWVEVTTEMHYTHNGTFSIKMVRVRDGKVIVDRAFDDMDLWRKGAKNIRNKFGIYRSFGSKMTGPADRPANGIKDETIDLADFRIYEADTNADPQTHD